MKHEGWLILRKHVFNDLNGKWRLLSMTGPVTSHKKWLIIKVCN